LKLRDQNSLKFEYDKRLYPFSFQKIKYNGFDSKGNIYLTVYSYSFGGKEDYKEIFQEINDIIESEQFAKEKSPFIILSEFYLNLLDLNYTKDKEEFIVDSSKILKFDGRRIPPLKIKTNENDSIIEVEIAN